MNSRVVPVMVLAVAAAFQLVDTLQVIGAGLLRGMKDTQVPMYIAMFSYWVVGMPAAYVLGFILDFGGQGIWSGLAIGLVLAGTSLGNAFFPQHTRHQPLESKTRHPVQSG